jgi:CHAT domain-containing protein
MVPTSCRRFFGAAVLALFASSGSAVRPEEAAYAHASVIFAQGRWLEAESFLRQVLPAYEAQDSDELWAMRALYGQVLTARGNFADALKVLALGLPPRLQRSVIAVRWLSYRAIALSRTHQDAAALADLDRAESMARHDQPQVLDEIFKWRANFAFNGNRQEEGEGYTRRGLRLARRYHHKQTEAELLATLAVIRTKRGRYDEAIELHTKVLGLATALHAESLVEKTKGNLAWAYSCIGDYDNVKWYADAALALAEKLGAARDVLPWLNQAGDLARLRGDYPTALAYYRRGVDLAKEQEHVDTGEYLANLAVAQLETGDTARARRNVAEAVTFTRQKKDPDEEARDSIIDARIDAAEGDLDSAIKKTQSVLATTTSTTRRWEAQARLAHFCQLAERPAEARIHFQEAIETADQARRDIKAEEFRLPFGALVREAYEDYVAFLISGGSVDEALAVAEMSRAQTLEEALGAGTVSHHEDPKRVARERHAILLSYWLAPKRSYVWVTSGDSTGLFELPPARKIEEAIELYSRELQSLRAGDQSRVGGAALFKMLVQPVAKRIPRGARVIVVPDGRLNAFNMETLIDPSSHYWIENVTIETVASLELLSRPRAEVSTASMLLVGDTPSPAPEFPRLTKAAEELELVQHHFASACKIVRGPEATPNAYQSIHAGRYGYVHFVAHGIATRERPLDSAVVLARDGDSYKLYARDIIKQRLHARLVTISSCHGAGTRAYTGEGLVGLAWAFLHAGAQQVIAALWEVNDNATPRLMNDLYAGIQAGKDPAVALRNAKLAMIRSGGPYRLPRYWAPFVLYSGS